MAKLIEQVLSKVLEAEATQKLQEAPYAEEQKTVLVSLYHKMT